MSWQFQPVVAPVPPAVPAVPAAAPAVPVEEPAAPVEVPAVPVGVPVEEPAVPVPVGARGVRGKMSKMSPGQFRNYLERLDHVLTQEDEDNKFITGDAKFVLELYCSGFFKNAHYARAFPDPQTLPTYEWVTSDQVYPCLWHESKFLWDDGRKVYGEHGGKYLVRK